MKIKKIRENLWVEVAIENLENREDFVVPLCPGWHCATGGIGCWIFPGDPCQVWGCISNFICSAPYT
ncbi:MAG: hypothetical protein ACXADY_17180 [Candidatus Hodarchaeales archaeon]|jgi:hypothetical protein